MNIKDFERTKNIFSNLSNNNKHINYPKKYIFNYN